MKKTKSKFWNNPWVVSIVSGLFVLLITIIVDLITAEMIFSTIKNAISAVWSAILELLNFNLKVWWVILSIVIITFGLFIFIKHKNAKMSPPDFLQYTKDSILGFTWKWRWGKNYYGKYEIEELHPICPQCDTPLVQEHSGYGFIYRCLRCGKKIHNEYPEIDNVKMLIADNVRRKYFPNE